jgi:hypothetical protein
MCFLLAIVTSKNATAAHNVLVVVLAFVALGAALATFYGRHKPKLGFED